MPVTIQQYWFIRKVQVSIVSPGSLGNIKARGEEEENAQGEECVPNSDEMCPE